MRKLAILVPLFMLTAAEGPSGCGTQEKVRHGLRVGAELTRGACALVVNDPGADPRARAACELVLSLPAPPG